MIKIVKLVTGEELIGDITEQGSRFVIKHPCLLQLVPSRSNQNEPTMAMFPYAVNTKEHEISVNSTFVIWNSEPVKELYNQYNSVFGSGIVMPSTGETTAFHPV
jgi:hypothetical protein